MTKTIELGDIVVDVIQKNIKNAHLSVYPPTGRVRISVPLHLSLDAIRAFAISKLGWIKQKQRNYVTKGVKRHENTSIMRFTMSGASVTCLKWYSEMPPPVWR